jgi:putative membrane protein
MYQTLLADGWHGGPGPWILLVPLFWAAVAFGVVTLVRRSRGWRGGPPWAAVRQAGAAGTQQFFRGGVPEPVDVLKRRYAEGELDEYEYRARLSVLTDEDPAAPGPTVTGTEAAPPADAPQDPPTER